MTYTLKQNNDEYRYPIKMYDTYHSFEYTISSDLSYVLDPDRYSIRVSLIGYDDTHYIKGVQTSAYGEFSFKISENYYTLVGAGSHLVYAWLTDNEGHITRIPSSLTIDIVKGCYAHETRE